MRSTPAKPVPRVKDRRYLTFRNRCAIHSGLRPCGTSNTELVMVRVKDKGDLYVHQDANWNVIGLTDLGGSLIERYMYSPYGELTVYQATGYGDYDGDGDVDSTDRAAGEAGGACRGSDPSGACRALDLDFDSDVDDTDLGLFNSLPQGLARHPGRIATNVDQPFGHQGLLFEPELGQYQNRARQYDPAKRRFVQRDPLAEGPGPDDKPDRLNVYRYVRNSPLVMSDPSGRECICRRGDDHTGCVGHLKKDCPAYTCYYKENIECCVWR